MAPQTRPMAAVRISILTRFAPCWITTPYIPKASPADINIINNICISILFRFPSILVRLDAVSFNDELYVVVGILHGAAEGFVYLCGLFDLHQTVIQ